MYRGFNHFSLNKYLSILDSTGLGTGFERRETTKSFIIQPLTFPDLFGKEL